MSFLPFTSVIRTNARNSAVYTAKKGKTRQQRQLLQQYPDYPISGTCASCMVFFNTVLLFINFPECAASADRDCQQVPAKNWNCNDPCTFTLRLTRIHIHGLPVIVHGALQLLCDLPSLQPCMGILWLQGCQPATDSQTRQGAMPAMP